MERRPAGEEFAEDGGGTSMILCLLKGYPGVTQISKVSAADGINGRDRWRHTDPAREFATIAEPAVEDLVRQDGCVVRTDRLQPGQSCDLRRRPSLASLGRIHHRGCLSRQHERITFGLDPGDLLFHECQPFPNPQDLLPSPRRERRPVRGFHIGELCLEILRTGAVLRCFAFLFTRRLAGSSTTVSRAMAPSSQRACQKPS